MAREQKSPERKTGVAAWNESVGIDSRRSATPGARQKKSVADRRRRIAMLVVLLVLCIACMVCFWPLNEQVKRGLYLKGGTEFSMAVKDGEGAQPKADELSSAVQIVSSRMGNVGVSEYRVVAKGADALAIDLPTSDDAQSIAQTVGGPGVVEFVRMDEIGDVDALMKINAGTKGVMLEKDTYTPFMDTSSVDSATVESQGSIHAVSLHLNEEGTTTFAQVTKELAEDYGRIAVVVDGRVVSAPSVSQELTDGVISITGDFSLEEANALKAVIDSEPIALDVSYAGSEPVGPLLGKQLVWGIAIFAVVVFAGVTAFAFVKCGKLAVLVSGAMAVYGILMLGLMALASRLDMFVLTLAGVSGGTCAAALTVVATWLMVTRFKDKASEGKSIRGAATSAPLEATKPLRMPCFVAFAVAVVLLFLPWAALREFGLTFVFGTICGLAAFCWYGITTLRLLATGTIQENPGAWGIAQKAEREADAREEATDR